MLITDTARVIIIRIAQKITITLSKKKNINH